MSEIAGPMKPLLTSATRIPKDMVALALSSAQRVQTGTTETHPDPKVRERHKMIVMLSIAGWKNDEIAKELGYSTTRVSVILRSTNPELVALRDQAAERIMENVIDVGSKIQLSAHSAFQVMFDLLKSSDEATKRLAAKDLLDRAGFAPIRKNINLDAKVPAEDLAGLLPKIVEANEVVAMSGQWEVRAIPPTKKE